MSLDIYLKVGEPVTKKSTGIFVFENGVKRELSKEDSMNLYGVNEEREYTSKMVWHGNITGNLSIMARKVPKCDYNDTLYKILWYPEECLVMYNNAIDISEALYCSIRYMIDNKEELLKYNPESGWGTYEQLLSFTKDYLKACLDYPDAKIEVSR